jgi:hypothetical protein
VGHFACPEIFSINFFALFLEIDIKPFKQIVKKLVTAN